MQNYKEINGNDYVKDSRTTINETMRSIQSMNSGTAFPTTNLFEGMKCYRTDLKKTYTLTDVENNTWVEDAHAELADEATHAASATKLQTPRAINLSGAVTADAASFDGTADATINVKTLDASKLKGTASVSTTGNAATATKLATARTIALSGNATGSTTFDGSGNATINATVNESAHAATATQVVATAPVGGGLDVIHAIMASDDAMRIRVYGDTDNGALEIATGDDGTEPIYARQYKNSSIDKFTTVARTAAILDTNGNTSFPGTVTAASFTGPLNGNATSATTATALKIVTYRPADANTQYGDGNMRHYLASASMTKNKPPTGDGHIINLAWDNNGGYDAQLYVNNTTGRLNMRGQTAGKWSNWLIGLDSGNFNDYAPTKTGAGASGSWNINASTATKLQTPRTISLTGNASGSANFDGSGNISINTTVNESKHAAAADTLKSSAATETSTVARPVWLSWEDDNTKQTVSPNLTYTCATKTLTAANFKGHLAGNADTATHATTADNVSGKIYYSSSSPSVATDKLFVVKQAHVGEDNVPNNGLVIQSGPTGANYNGKLYLADNGGNGVWVGGVAAGKEVGWKRLVENWGSWNINAATATNATKATTAAACTGNSATASRLATARSIALTGNATGSAAFDGSGNISISTNVNTASNADKLDGYHASDIINRITAANTGGIVAASLTANGYVKFANGLILQWGNASGYDEDEKDSYSTFPIAFSSTCFVVLLTSRKYMVTNRLYNQSKTGFTWTSRSGLISWAALGM